MPAGWSRCWQWHFWRAKRYRLRPISGGEPLPEFAGAFGIAALYQALAIGRMGVVAPVASVVTGVLPVLVGIRTEGMPDRVQLAGFALALVSVWLVARPNEYVDSHRGLGLAVLAGVMFGLFLVAGKQAGHHGVFWPMVAARAGIDHADAGDCRDFAARPAAFDSRGLAHGVLRASRLCG